jgi:hypothetical protein
VVLPPPYGRYTYNLVFKGIYMRPIEMVSVTHPDESNST